VNLQIERHQKRMPKLFWGLCFICCLIVVFFQIPLSWLGSVVANQTGCRVLLEQPMGTIWQGSTALGFSEPNVGGDGCRKPMAITERFRWITSCKLGDLTCHSEIHFAALEKPQLIDWNRQQIRFAENSVQLPTNILEALGNPWSTLRPRGELGMRWTSINFQGFLGGEGVKYQAAGIIRIMVDNLSSPISPVKPLGSYEIQANLDQAGLNWSLLTTNGPLLLQGNGGVGMQAGDQGMRFSGEASAAPEAQESLIGLLSLLGKKEGNVYRLKL
jgi:general secretion pathway protein N